MSFKLAVFHQLERNFDRASGSRIHQEFGRPIRATQLCRCQSVQRTHDFHTRLKVRVNHGRGNVLMPQQFLDRPDISPATQQMRRKTMAECVTCNVLQNAGCLHRMSQMSGKRVEMDMVTMQPACPGIARQPSRGK